MKKLFDRAVSAAREKPVRFTAIVLLALLAFAIGVSFGDPLGRELYVMTH